MNVHITQKHSDKVKLDSQATRQSRQYTGVDLDIDPDLNKDVDIPLPRDNLTSGKTRTVMSSARSRKTNQSSRKSEAITDRANIVRSRGRPIKPHETEPFLTIDNLPPDKTFVSEKATDNASPRPASNRTGYPVKPKSPRFVSQLQRVSTYMSPYDQATPGPPRSNTSRNGRVTPANTPYQSPNKPIRPPNHHVKSPFKHSVNKPEPLPEGRQTPSMGMKERTALAAYHINKVMVVAGQKDARKVPGKLQKGKLKPLYPVNVEGPKITQCRGIISDTKSYGASPSRTLQRRLHLMNSIPNVREYLYDRPRTVESVHQTSIASSIDDYVDDDENMDTNRSLPDEIIYPVQKNGSILEPVTPENTFIPVQTQEGLPEATPMSEATPRMFATEVGVADLENPDTVDISLTDHLQHELYIGNSNQVCAETNVIGAADKNNSNAAVGNNEQESDKVETQANDQQKLRIGSSSKSVRFVENKAGESSTNSKEMKQLTNASIAKQQKELQEKGEENTDKAETDNDVKRKNNQNLQSCKSEEIMKNEHKDDEEDEDGRRGGDSNKGRDSNDKIADAGIQSSANDGSGDYSKDSSGNTGNNNSNGQKQAKTKETKDSESRKYNKSRSAHSQGLSARKSRPPSGKGKSCRKFSQSSASKPHTPKLQVTGVIHGDGYQTGVSPESPSRSPSRPRSPSREGGTFYLENGRPRFEEEESNFWSSIYAQKSKVKFMVEGEVAPMETIFVEDGDDVELRQDKELTFDDIDSELNNMQQAIQNEIFALPDDVDESETSLVESDTEVVEVENEDENNEESDEEEQREKEAEEVESVRGEYTKLLDKYRQRCMDRSETFGAISGSLITPRDAAGIFDKMRPGSQVRGRKKRVSSAGSLGRSDSGLNTTVCSDSGHGSVENLSELSRSASIAISEVPRLDLGGSTSDIGMDTGRSDVTVTQEEEEVTEGKNLLEMVCSELSPLEKKKEKKETRKELEEDVSKLTVVATTKSLSKTKQQRPVASLKPQLPPLCFTINARAPHGYLYYFAYGPDMNPDRFSSYIKREVTKRQWGLLFGFSLVFNKRGTSEEAGGFANLEYNPLRSVEGCMYTITPQELKVLDQCVGYPVHYEHLMLPVWLSNNADPQQCGVAQYCVPALMYIAQNDWTETEKTLPSDYSLSQCIKSADLLTTEYRESLVAMSTNQQVSVSA